MSSHGGELLLILFPYVITVLVLIGLLDDDWPSGSRRDPVDAPASPISHLVRRSTFAALSSTVVNGPPRWWN